jgi:hypothetical protein
MELLDRYLQAVEFWLPKRQRRDMITELSEDLRSQVEDKESELGRKLTEAEVEEILNRCGSPMTVALRYRPQQFLIGPALFPIYRFVLGVLLIGCIVPRILIWLAFLLIDPVHRGYLHMENLWATAVFFVFFTTLAFAILERSGVKLELNRWNPRKLPPLRDPNRISRSGALAEIAMAVIFNIWFAVTFWPQSTDLGKIGLHRLGLRGVEVTLASVWRFFFWSLLLVAVANVALAAVNLFRPHWTARRATLRLLFDAAGAGLICWLLKAQALAGIAVPGLPAAKALVLTNCINLWMAKMLPWAIVVMVVILCFDGYRILRLRGICGSGNSLEPVVKQVSNLMVSGR